MTDKGLFSGDGEMRELMRTFDWSNNPLGPPETWPQSLRTTVRTMLASRYAMWMAWGPELTFLYNDTYGRVTLGKKHPWALGKPAQVVWREIWNDLSPRIDSVFATGQATWDEGLLLFLERSGFPEETYHTFSYSPLATDDGSLAGMLCVVTEETERVLGERQLASLRDLAASLTRAKTETEVFSAVRESLSRSDRDLPFTLIYQVDDSRETATLATQTGFNESQAALAPETIRLEASDAVWPIAEVLQTRTLVEIDLLRISEAWPTGGWPEARATAVAVPIAGRGDDFPSGVLITGLNRYRKLDETYRGFLQLVAGQIAGGIGSARAYEQERKRAEALAELDRAKTAFFSNVSHELRTPLTLLLGPLEHELERARRSGQDPAHLELMQRNALRLFKLVNTLLEFSRVEAGRVTAQFRSVDLQSLTANLASNFRSAMERAGLTLTVEGDLRDPVYVDPEMWEKIVFNLLSNAFKSTFEGSIAVRIGNIENQAYLEVSDTGTGIPAGDLPHLFERFRRVEGARRRSHEGSGIGLALVHELIRMHGGSISVESQVGKGTTFRVLLPLGSSHLPAEHILQGGAETRTGAIAAYIEEVESWVSDQQELQSSAAISNEVPEIESSLRDASVLVVDDNRDMRQYVAGLLGKRFQIKTAEHGVAALAIIRSSPPELILSDVMMPEMDGFELLSAVRAQEDTREIPFILLSARAGEESRVEGMEAGADDYLVKPFTARELVARVTAHLGMARMRKAAADRERELLHETESERRRLEALLLQAPAAICVLSGPDHRFALANPMYLELIGIKRGQDIYGKKLLEALPEIASQGFNELLDRVFETGEPFVGTEAPVTLARGPQGEFETVYLNFVYQPWRTAEGRVEGIFVHAVDVTENVSARRTVEQLAASVQKNEARLNAILRQVVSGICQLDKEGRFEFFNDRLCEISGQNAEGLKSGLFFDLVHPDDRGEIQRVMDSLFRDGHATELVQRWCRADGSEVWVQQNLSGVFDEQGLVASVVCVVQDVTAKKEAEEALRRSEKLAAVGQLASTIAHEINNPLESVTNLLYLMQNNESFDEIQSYAQIASSELMRVSHVVTSTLQFHRKPLEWKPEELAPLLRSAITLYEARIRSSGIEIITEFEEVPSIWCFGSELRQVFTNLMGNAFDATKNAPERRIILRMREATSPRGKKGVRITIADSGKGMDETTQKKIFDPFFTTKGMNGSGLGLWLSMDIVRKHRAAMTYRSKPGHGSVFAIWLPQHANYPSSM